MRKKLVLGTILMLALLIVTIVAAVVPALATSKKEDDSNPVFSGIGGTVIVALPPAPNKPGTVIPAHPVDLRFVAIGHNRRSAYGAFDSLLVYLWSAPTNVFQPVAVISDNPDASEFWMKAWNKTFVWTENQPYKNVVTVTDKELEIWTETIWPQSGHGNKGLDMDNSEVLFVNLTKQVHVTLPFPPPVGDLSFDLPAFNMTFRGIGDTYRVEETIGLPSGYQIKNSHWRTPAWVEVTIPTWLRGIPLEVTGHTNKGTETYVPPPT